MSDSTDPVTTHRIAVLPGDGIGKEVVPPTMELVERAAAPSGVGFEWETFDWGCERYAATGAMMPDDAVDTLAGFDAILLGAVGAPGVPDHVSLWGMLIPIRRAFGQYVNLRPIRWLKGIRSPLQEELAASLDLVVVRENSEGEYSQVGGRLFPGSPREVAVQEAAFSRVGVERIARFAFELAQERRGRVTSATKSNGIVHTMPFWDEVVGEVAAQHPDVAYDQRHIDALCARCVLQPGDLDVIVASNLFGDVLSDLTAALAGGLGIAPSANLDPSGEHPSMFEPVHGSAPDIAGRGVANPIGQVWSAAMMLTHLGHDHVARQLMEAIERVIRNGDVLTADLGGRATTTEMAAALEEQLTSGTAAAGR